MVIDKKHKKQTVLGMLECFCNLASIHHIINMMYYDDIYI